MPGPVVSNSSPLIALEWLGRLDLLQQLFGTVLVPPAVVKEVGWEAAALPRWITEQSLAQPVGPRILRGALGPGESETLSLALEVGARLAIMDDRPARRLAAMLQLPVVGTLGIIVEAKRRGLLPLVRPCLDTLLDHGFRAHPDLLCRVLTDAGEEGEEG